MIYAREKYVKMSSLSSVFTTKGQRIWYVWWWFYVHHMGATRIFNLNVYDMRGDGFMYTMWVLLGWGWRHLLWALCPHHCLPSNFGGWGEDTFRRTMLSCMNGFFDRLTFTLLINASIHQNGARMRWFRSLSLELYPNCCQSLTLQ